jgi:hypothetical protein
MSASARVAVTFGEYRGYSLFVRVVLTRTGDGGQ